MSEGLAVFLITILVHETVMDNSICPFCCTRHTFWDDEACTHCRWCHQEGCDTNCDMENWCENRFNIGVHHTGTFNRYLRYAYIMSQK